MKLRMISALTGAMILSGESQANYLGLGYTAQAVTVAGVARTVYRIYAAFSNGNDQLTAVGGSVANGAATIKNTDASGLNPGTGFFNAGGLSGPPTTSGGAFTAGPNAEWDTYVTI